MDPLTKNVHSILRHVSNSMHGWVDLSLFSSEWHLWFIHVMLFYHTRNVIKKQENKARKEEAGKMDDNEDGGSDDEAS